MSGYDERSEGKAFMTSPDSFGLKARVKGVSKSTHLCSHGVASALRVQSFHSDIDHIVFLLLHGAANPNNSKLDTQNI